MHHSRRSATVRKRRAPRLPVTVSQRELELIIENCHLRAQLKRYQAAGHETQAQRLTALLEQRERQAKIGLLIEPSVSGPRRPDAAKVPAGPSALPGMASIQQPSSAEIPSPQQPRRCQWSAWGFSTAMHVAILVVMALVSLATLPDQPIVLLSSPLEREDDLIAALSEVQLDTEPLAEVSSEPIPFQAFRPEIPEMLDEELLESLTPAAAMPQPSLEVPLLSATDVRSLLTPRGARSQEEGAGSRRGGAGGAKEGHSSFFGASSRGNRIVYVIDNSGTMQQGRMETALLELQQSVHALQADQLFSVIFYSDQAYPLFYPNSVMELIPATPENQQKLDAWLTTIEMCKGGQVDEAMTLAAKFHPNVVYLLSDGDIRSERMMQMLTAENDWDFVVHTCGMTIRSAEDAAKLQAIAAAHDGMFQHVQISPAAARRAQQRWIPYHSHAGKVWGTKVRDW